MENCLMGERDKQIDELIRAILQEDWGYCRKEFPSGWNSRGCPYTRDDVPIFRRRSLIVQRSRRCQNYCYVGHCPQKGKSAGDTYTNPQEANAARALAFMSVNP